MSLEQHRILCHLPTDIIYAYIYLDCHNETKGQQGHSFCLYDSITVKTRNKIDPPRTSQPMASSDPQYRSAALFSRSKVDKRSKSRTRTQHSTAPPMFKRILSSTPDQIRVYTQELRGATASAEGITCIQPPMNVQRVSRADGSKNVHDFVTSQTTSRSWWHFIYIYRIQTVAA